ncbi:hypothetical protein [Mucilaginibacter calamicampi]|uniref:hypothetical protein n=1 Tax=Mucilaginibacter calamicampi TaxID=1302352 RepID=UPI003670C1DB
MVSLFRFLDLDINEKANYVWQGTYIATRTETDKRILLYNLGEFYAEVVYDALNNEITYIKGFRANSHLVPYMNLLPYDSLSL